MDISLILLFLLSPLGCVRAQQPPPRVTQIDDSDVCTPLNPTGIQYSTGWTPITDASGRYMNTLMTVSIKDASAVFFFKGIFIGYFADIWPDHTIAYVSIDGLPAVTVPSTGNSTAQQLLWSASDLNEGDHQIIVTHGGDSSGAPLFITLDYFVIGHNGEMLASMLGPGATNAHSEFIVDDGHNDIVYEGEWSTMQPNPQQSFYYGGLQSTTTTPGSSLTFSFIGTAVYYFSDKRAQNGQALISIDGGKGELVSTFLEPGDDRWLSQVLCWSKTGLSNGPHTVKITHSDQEGNSGATQVPKKIPLPAIIGSSVGGGVALLLAAIICYLIYRKRSRSIVPEGREPEAGQQENGAPQPQLERPGLYPVSYYSEKWSPNGQSNSPKTMSGLNERSVVQSHAGPPEV